MGTVFVFAFAGAIENFPAVLLGFGLAAWTLGDSLKRWGLGPTARSLVYALFGMIGGLLMYYNYGFARDGSHLYALILVGAAMYILCFFLALAITLVNSRRGTPSERS